MYVSEIECELVPIAPVLLSQDPQRIHCACVAPNSPIEPPAQIPLSLKHVTNSDHTLIQSQELMDVPFSLHAATF